MLLQPERSTRLNKVFIIFTLSISHLHVKEFAKISKPYSNFICFDFLSIDPDNERIKGNLIYYRASLQRMKTTGERGDSGTLDESATKVVKRSVSKQDEWKERKSHMDYERLCRGETRKLVRLQLNFFSITVKISLYTWCATSANPLICLFSCYWELFDLVCAVSNIVLLLESVLQLCTSNFCF